MSRLSDTTIATKELAVSLGMTESEYDHVCRFLERQPSYAEAGIFSAMYSEHCSYKSSKPLLKKLPTEGKNVLQGPGENAGVIDIGNGWAVAFKVESHNHPSFIEPYQGAATGVGGILRDVFTMGARPIAALDGLFFGSPDLEKTLQVAKGVVRGVGDYGNNFGVPTVGGQTLFHPCYNGNPLVNAFTLGVLKQDNLFRGYASGEGNLLVYVGAKTGRDGVHGATMASQEFSTEKELDRPAVQVGDPFTEKLLLEACLEAMKAKLIVGIQDMGAAGLTSSSFEMAHRAKTGLLVDLDKIPVRESAMSAYELLLSESQERMLIVAEPDKFDELKATYEKWDLHVETIGKVTDGNRVQMNYQGKQVVDLPVELVVNPPEPEDPPTLQTQDQRQSWFLDRNPIISAPLEKKFQTLFSDINFADVSPVTVQYDSTIGVRTTSETFDDCAVMRVREMGKDEVRLALSMDVNPRICRLWPREGARRAVAESAINLAVRGAAPLGLTDCLNFGNPNNPEVYWQLSECIEGMREACLALDIPVVSGNVSLYNDTDGQPIYPTPTVATVGIIRNQLPIPKNTLYEGELELGLIGQPEAGLGGSVFASRWFDRECGKPEQTDLAIVKRVIALCQALQSSKMTYAIHDVSDGGIISCALEMAFRAPVLSGLDLSVPMGKDLDNFLFGEAVPRILVAYDPEKRFEMEMHCSRQSVPFHVIGSSTEEDCFRILQGNSELINQPMQELKGRWAKKWKGIFL